MDFPNIHDRSRYPGMARWFSPLLLTKLLWNVFLSQVFGQYADRRLLVAALDTYPIATLLARKSLKIGDRELPRGEVLIMGGDQVYPAATQKAYQHQLRDPYNMALPDANYRAPDGIPLYAIPGNHDWYDGLVMFLAFFARHESVHFGGWRTRQRRSYFALQLTCDWWLWCTDIQLADDRDQPQADYFEMIARRMDKDSKIILVSAEPGWLYTLRTDNSFEILGYAANIAGNANKGFTIPVILSGDTHHYSRYSNENNAQFITSGGGGAFLHPTHQLRDEITEVRPKENRKTLQPIQWLKKPTKLSLQPSRYPDRKRSRNLLRGNLFFAVTNFDLAVLLGIFYWLFSLAIFVRNRLDTYLVIVAAFVYALDAYTRYQNGDGVRIGLASAFHALIHAGVVFFLANWVARCNTNHLVLYDEWYDIWIRLSVTALEIIPVGAVIAGTIFGVYLAVTCAWCDMNHNDAFSAMRLDSYKNFLRFHIKGDEVTIYPIGLDRVPRRRDWEKNTSAAPGNQDQPLYVPKMPLQPHLIEDPVVVRADAGTTKPPKV